MTLHARAAALILMAAFVQFSPGGRERAITYDGVPREVTRIEAFQWQDDTAPRPIDPGISRSNGRVTISASLRGQVVIVFRRQDGRYAIDGPMPWPALDIARAVPATWMRSVGGAIPAEVAQDAVPEFVSIDSTGGPWPRCFRGERASWQCWGVSDTNAGVVTLASAGTLWWSVANGDPGSVLRAARWGRLVLVDGAENSSSPLRATFSYPVPPPPERLVATRLDTAPVADAQFASVAPHALWIGGGTPPARSWAEIKTDDLGPSYLSLAEAAEGPSSLPIHLRLPPRRTVAGKVTAADGQAAPRALVTMFRAIEPPPRPGSSLTPRRVLATELVADDGGEFVVEGVGEGDYEIVGWHTQLGRGSTVLSPTQTSVALTLRAAGVAHGRVMSGGSPASGVDVISVPDMAAFNAARDMTDVKGGDARTGADGRFTVMLAGGGGGELRVGGGSYAVKRVPLPRPAPANLDLGDIELSPSITLTIVLDRDVGCAVRAVGPIGRSGLQVISGTRTPAGTFTLTVPEPGLWQFGLVCPGEKHALAPATMQVTTEQAGKEVTFAVK